ncbi:hypothetical protein E3V39_12510 [Gammaproteobacteria bacterium LSUCC0112]|nr:hypothetical protein E3V39_12510 [Gammaproteobacteria bacterium LSUCC0112]
MKHFDTEAGAKLRAFLDSQEVKDVISGIEKSAESDTGSFEVVITTENLDRYNEVIKLDGWELEHYRKNPVVLWGHDHKLLIGMATSLEVVDGKMIAKGKFAPNALGQEVRALYEAGFLKATSVGFIEKERQGNLITQAELIEFSFVSVPANPYALSLAMEKELNLNELVTKGFMDIKEAEAVQEEVPKVEPVVEETTEPVVDEKKFSAKAVTPLVDQLKSVITALEALSDEEPERVEEPVEDTDEEKGLKEFSEKRRIIQEASTILGDVLAEARQAIQAKK